MKRISTACAILLKIFGLAIIDDDPEIGDFSALLASSIDRTIDTVALPNGYWANTIATEIAESAHLIKKATVTQVCYDEPSQTWIVSLDEHPLKAGGVLYVALRKADAKVVRIWTEQ